MGMQSVWDHIRLAAERTPSGIAVVDDRSERCVTYLELVEEVENAAAGLFSAGFQPGQFVATILPNVLEHIFAILALHRLGTIVCMINPRLKPEEAGDLMVDAGMAGAICASDPEIVSAARMALPDGAPIFTVGGVEDHDNSFKMCRGDRAGLPAWKSPDPEGVAFVLYTSGTTGLPKSDDSSQGNRCKSAICSGSVRTASRSTKSGTGIDAAFSCCRFLFRACNNTLSEWYLLCALCLRTIDGG